MENYDVIINPETGDCEILRTRTIVEDDELENESMEIALSAAQKIDEDYEVGEEVVARGKIEKVLKNGEFEKYRILVGTTRESLNEYIKLRESPV